jgi:hypothetical protein
VIEASYGCGEVYLRFPTLTSPTSRYPEKSVASKTKFGRHDAA